ncbi:MULTISPECIES: class Ib ribonucleoside-diphosphate reductase assembly flavoprotein NrdI [Bacillus]|uniref:class Ib ribonucleoside-diphosphate reductase assembly flavoprotein NrdI n=1 Tax=Bacillus TaxID=1386 RepID=UPI0003030C3A|nr:MULTISPECIES: class Ib ribonucleoside-diphosphate reductase assembly flavoprotein NrdI [Bacillus]
MLIVYDSLTGNVKRFIQKVESKAQKITEGLIVKEPFILVTYTVGFGEVPKSTIDFLSNNYPFLQGVATSGNRVWGANFGKAGERISNKYLVPLLLKFELSGTKQDIEVFKQGVAQLDERTNSEMVKA